MYFASATSNFPVNPVRYPAARNTAGYVCAHWAGVSGVTKSTTPCRRSHCPVKIDARLQLQIAVVTKWFVNRTPAPASASMFGVRISEFPAHPIASNRWSSVSRKTMFGLAASAARAPAAHTNIAHHRKMSRTPRATGTVILSDMPAFSPRPARVSGGFAGLQFDPRPRPPLDLLQPDPPAVGIDDLLADGQADAAAGALGGAEPGEGVDALFQGDAATLVLDFDASDPVGRVSSDRQSAATGHGVRGINHEVQQHLLDLAGVGDCDGGAAFDVGTDARVPQPAVEQLQHLRRQC